MGLPTVPCGEDEWRSVSSGDWRELHQWTGAWTHCHSDQVVWFITAAAREKAIKQHSCRQLNAMSRCPWLPLAFLSLPLTLSSFLLFLGHNFSYVSLPASLLPFSFFLHSFMLLSLSHPHSFHLHFLPPTSSIYLLHPPFISFHVFHFFLSANTYKFSPL